MTTHPVILRLSELTSISAEVRTLLASKFIKQTCSANQILLGERHKPTYFYFLEKGLLRTYYQKKSKEITRDFLSENEFLFPANFFRRGISKDSIAAIRGSTLHTISYEDLMQVLFDHPELNHGLRELQEYQYDRCLERDRLLRITSAAERYRQFASRNENILRYVTLPMLSSYLNISRKHLSRIKNLEAFRK